MKHRSPRRSFHIHPYRIFVFLLISAITILFLSLTIAYMYTRIESGMEPIALPWIFYLNVIVLLISSYLMIVAKRSYETDNIQKYMQSLLVTLLLTLIFLMGQGLGWYELLSKEILLDYSTGTSYLYLISALHFTHVLVGLPFLISFYLSARANMSEPVNVLLYFSDPEKEVRLDLLSVYWHFLDGLWIYLVMFFAVNYLLSPGIFHG